MNRTTRALFALLAATALALAAAGPSPAHEKDKSHAAAAVPERRGAWPPPQAVTIQGELIDPQCYFTHASRGPEHAGCARMCAKGGQNLAFLHEASGVVYPLVAQAHGKNPNDGLLDHIGKIVRVKGTIYRVGQNAVIMLQSVEDV